MYLLDTNIVSASRKRHRPVLDWLGKQKQSELWLSAITIGELTRGVFMLERRDHAAATHLANWLARLRHLYFDRTLGIDEAICLEWGRIAAMRTRGDADGLIAATAIVHGLTLVTRNIADFSDTGVRLVNPWDV